ncbi:Calcineurin-like phosphoesterase [Corynebacterium kalinowskii]|uniref:Calcineurin-like phosphoesterase n=1 Tax=Corynebacterium kalinowskii TaxID=2675216 RepID=A0A6B8VLB9_9CORY|nr:metallophosphoesterase [Corynebacterium kalinowskii]QGU02244.1 Calcineurin-like phosphoesterase [Corynebacterium kalinowskii]
MSSRPLVALIASLSLVHGAITAPIAVAADAAPGFRITPYLMKPAANEMTLTWFGETNAPATVTVTSPKGEVVVNETVTGEAQPHLAYTSAELAQKIEGLEQGSWLKSNTNVKYQAHATSLTPNTKYSYTVELDGHTYTDSFTTAPAQGGTWDEFRVIAFSDSETEPAGRPTVSGAREWEAPESYAEGSLPRPTEGSAWFEKFGHNKRLGKEEPRYPLTQDQAMRENLKIIQGQDPDLLMVAGDLVQGGGYQPGWDEFFGYMAGENGDLAGSVPMITALGNWETFGALNGGYLNDAGVAAGPAKGRKAYQTYIDTFGSDNPNHADSYHRVDHGPLTIITLDSTNGLPDQDADVEKLKAIPGDDTAIAAADAFGTDTNTSYTEEQIRAAGSEDQPDFNPGSEQWNWAEKQLADAREKGQIIVVQFHHSAYSSGVHGTAMASATSDEQPGSPMRVYEPLLEKYGVATVISGHDEMFERSFVDADGDGTGIHHFDVGVAADGLRGEYNVKNEDGTYTPVKFNSHSEWMAQTDAPELWQDIDGTRQLIDGGKHYGHLQMDFAPLQCSNAVAAKITTTPVYAFPVLDKDYNLVQVERRQYNDIQEIYVDSKGNTLPRGTACDSATAGNTGGSAETSSTGSAIGGLIAALLPILALVSAIGLAPQHPLVVQLKRQAEQLGIRM